LNILFYDRCRIHCTDEINNYLEDNNIIFLKNSSYCPEYNSIELFFNLFKYNLRNKVWSDNGSIFEKCVKSFKMISKENVRSFINKSWKNLNSNHN